MNYSNERNPRKYKQERKQKNKTYNQKDRPTTHNQTETAKYFVLRTLYYVLAPE